MTDRIELHAWLGDAPLEAISASSSNVAYGQAKEWLRTDQAEVVEMRVDGATHETFTKDDLPELEACYADMRPFVRSAQ